MLRIITILSVVSIIGCTKPGPRLETFQDAERLYWSSGMGAVQHANSEHVEDMMNKKFEAQRNLQATLNGLAKSAGNTDLDIAQCRAYALDTGSCLAAKRMQRGSK